MASRVEGLASFRERVLKRLPAAAKAKIKAANQKNAEEFRNLVASIVPRGDPKPPNLSESLALKPGQLDETAFLVTIGGPNAPYPLHLEAGHRTESGSHVPGEPYWYPSLRVLKKRTKRRIARALNEAVKITAQGPLGKA